MIFDYQLGHTNKKGIPFTIRIGTCDENVLNEVISNDCYKLEQIHLRQDPTIVDVGGHIGAFTKYCAWRWPYSKIHTFEANPNNWGILESNINDINDKVTLYKGACVGKVPKNKQLVINRGQAKEITGGAGILFHNGDVKADENTATIAIDNFYSLSDLLSKVDKIDLLKLDCEGSEFSILKELTKEELYKIDYLVCEVHCGALPHHDWSYKKFRSRILRQFICPELKGRRFCGRDDLFNIVACNKKLISKGTPSSHLRGRKS